MIPHATLSMMCSLSFYTRKLKKSKCTFKKDTNIPVIPENFWFVCLLGGVGWDLTENQRVKQINSYPILITYKIVSQKENHQEYLSFIFT